MGKPYVVYGQKGSGSVPVEATLHLLGETYELVERRPGDDQHGGVGGSRLPRAADGLDQRK